MSAASVAPDGPGPLAILAGSGPLPGRVAAAARATGRSVFVVGFEGFADPATVALHPHVWARPAAAGRILAALRGAGCREVVLIGPVRRPSFRDLRPDAEGARLLGRIGRSFFSGDDGLLAAIVRVLGEEGFTVRGAHELLNRGAVAGAGRLGRHAPDAAASADVARGVAVLEITGPADIGQACVVQAGAVLAVEAIEGTDAMLARAGELALAAPGGVLVKLPKPAQDRRADLPTIGPATVERAAAAGLRGIAIASDETLLIDRAALIATADRLGLFLLGLDPAPAGNTEETAE